MSKEIDEIVDEYCEKHPHLKPYRDEMRRERRKGPSIAEQALAHFRKPRHGLIREFVNERGNQIRMEATLSPEGVTVKARSPSSECEHTWTIEEARTLHKLLASALWETFHG